MIETVRHLNEDAVKSALTQNDIYTNMNFKRKCNPRINDAKSFKNDKMETPKGLNRTEPIVAKIKETRRTRKRPGKRLKAKPSKRFKKISIKGFYWGKLSNLVFFKQFYKSNASSDDDSLFSI